MDIDILSVALGSGVTVAVWAFSKYAPKVAAKTETKLDDAAVELLKQWLNDPANQVKIVDLIKSGFGSSPKK